MPDQVRHDERKNEMIQIVIFGIAFMLFVKGFDMLHQQSIARAAGTPGSNAMLILGILVAFLGGVFLIMLSFGQAAEMPPPPSFGNF